MKIPRDLSGAKLAGRLKKLGYEITRQTGSHIRLTTHEKGEHHLTIPDHSSLKIGTLASTLSDICGHFGLNRDELLKKLFGK